MKRVQQQRLKRLALMSPWMILGIGPDYFLNLIVSGIVFLIASIMQEGLKLKEEQALTV